MRDQSRPGPIRPLWLLLTTMGLSATAAAAPAPRPNIVLVLVDDMGFSDIGCYGGEIATPNLDRLAARGLRFKQFYNTGRCCPTRASLMTGLHPHQAGIGHMTETPEVPSPLENEPYQGYLNDRCVTIAQVLRRAGYHTLMAGKWHLGYHRQETWPLQRGFDRYFGILSGASHYMRPEAPRGLTYMNEPVEAPEGFYTTEAFTDYALRFIEEVVPSDASVGAAEPGDQRPFFLYLAYNAPHWPLQARPADLARYEETYRVGWHEISRRRFERQVALGLVDPRWTPAPHEGPFWDSLGEESKRLQSLRMAAYAGCVDSIDQNIGRLVRRLESLGIANDTIILFLSDNGACQEGGILGSGDEESIRNPLSTRGTDGPRVGRVWANASNTPFRRYKHFVHEGGMSTPLIVYWPGGLPRERHGAFVEELAYLPDVMPTLVELAGAEYPAVWNGQPIPAPAGRSLVPLLQGVDGPVHEEPVFWEHEGNRAMRDGRWKLVWSGSGPWELYDMEKDRTEMYDLSGVMPRRLSHMRRQWESWARRTGVQFQESFSYYRMLKDFTDSEGPIESEP